MSEEQEQKTGQELIASEQKGAELIQLKINKETNELTFINPANGKRVTVQAQIEEEERETEDEEGDIRHSPLSPEDFRSVLERLGELGLTWSADIPPRPRFKSGIEPGQAFGNDYYDIQRTYPTFPRELGAVVMAAIMGSKQQVDLVGSKGVLNKKIAILHDIGLVNPEYRSEFFFKHSIKVPYFEDADWEIVIKTHERGVKPMPKSAYALLSLAIRSPTDYTLPIDEAANEYVRPQFITVAANDYLLDKLITLLKNAKKALRKAEIVAHSLDDRPEESEVRADGSDANS